MYLFLYMHDDMIQINGLVVLYRLWTTVHILHVHSTITPGGCRCVAVVLVLGCRCGSGGRILALRFGAGVEVPAAIVDGRGAEVRRLR